MSRDRERRMRPQLSLQSDRTHGIEQGKTLSRIIMLLGFDSFTKRRELRACLLLVLDVRVLQKRRIYVFTGWINHSCSTHLLPVVSLIWVYTTIRKFPSTYWTMKKTLRSHLRTSEGMVVKGFVFLN